jgi:glutamyl-tRNA synthetase
MELIAGHKQLSKITADQRRDLLTKTIASLQKSNFKKADLTQRLNALLELTAQKPSVLFSLIRLATTWAPASPGLADTLEILGKERSLQRLNETLESLTA